MTPRNLTNVAIISCLVIGSVCCCVRYDSLRRNEAAREDTQWELTYLANFEPNSTTAQQESQVRFGVPFDTRYCQSVPGNESWTVSNPNLHAKITRPYHAT